MAEIPELGVEPKSTGTLSGSWWATAAKTLCREFILNYF
jgi:hypothetical protein